VGREEQKALRNKFHECQEVWYGVHDLQKVRTVGGTIGQSGCAPSACSVAGTDSVRLLSSLTHTYLAVRSWRIARSRWWRSPTVTTSCARSRSR
jgi:hypothetical protein